jgi:hypothetical protein
MEFSDGIYDIKNNIFINKNKNNLNLFIKQQIKTIKYYNRSYQRIRQDKPNN